VTTGRPEGTTLRIVTRGRVTGREHVATTWFAPAGGSLYVAARHGTESDWLRNALAASEIELRQRRGTWRAGAALVSDPGEIERAVEAFATKYAKHPAIIEAWRADPPTFVRFTIRR
jgi:hypothetical protein